MSAVVILATVNPATLRLKLPRFEITRRQTFAACAVTEQCAPCGMKYKVLARRADGSTAESSGDCAEFTRTDAEMNDAILVDYSVAAECIGRGCGSDQITGGTTKCSSEFFRCATGSETVFACGAKPAAAQPGYSCRQCKQDGNKCGVAGANDECCGGYCANGIGLDNHCASGEPGDECDNNGECKSSICQTKYGNSCSSGDTGSPCGDVKECKQGFACSNGICMPPVVFNPCAQTDDCAKGMHCINNACVPQDVNGINDFRHKYCDPSQVHCATILGIESCVSGCCTQNGDCSSHGGFCSTMTRGPGGSSGEPFCTNGGIGVSCVSNEQCLNNRCASGICVSGANGGACNDKGDCASSKCYKGGDFGVCVSGGRGSRCNDTDAPCLSGMRCASDHRCVENS